MHTMLNICARPTRESVPTEQPPRLTPFEFHLDGTPYWICAPSDRVARAVASRRAQQLRLGGALVIVAVPMMIEGLA